MSFICLTDLVPSCLFDSSPAKQLTGRSLTKGLTPVNCYQLSSHVFIEFSMRMRSCWLLIGCDHYSQSNGGTNFSTCSRDGWLLNSAHTSRRARNSASVNGRGWRMQGRGSAMHNCLSLMSGVALLTPLRKLKGSNHFGISSVNKRTNYQSPALLSAVG